ncbi:hypothetical protein QC761_0074620 [Podospora bellae-mahoneyi]|uniref:Uncharacterized protein n=1 Tax=Podospora bellae-mahoneyi TaxID=2093777 RepID=A0ABR0FDW8_9PEZI|nr:hypothetical protein QC761_0074620 [Podospora bellae-mahoneyi]
MDEWCSEPEPDGDPVVQGDVLLVLPAGVGVGAEGGGRKVARSGMEERGCWDMARRAGQAWGETKGE